jgi:isochorismate synthase
MDELKLKDFASRFLYLLHPTPAVCGLPKNEALSFILEHEIHNREFYSGFLGPVNMTSGRGRNSSSLYVNLRCMKLRENTAILYAGCGITVESEPEKEWQETELKANTLLSVIYD